MSGHPGHSPDVRISPLTRNAVRLLINGEWMPVEQLVQKLIPKVHPGKAARQAERARLHSHKDPGPPKRVKNTEEDRILRIGARQLVYQNLRATFLERSEDRSQIRIRPTHLDNAKKLIERLAREGGEAAFSDM